MERILSVARILVGGVFLVTGVLKIPEVEDVSLFVAQVTALPSRWAYTLAGVLVMLEVVTGAGLVIGRIVRLCNTVATALLLAFLSAPVVYQASWTGRQCPCFGLLAPEVSREIHLLLNLVLLNASVVMMVTGYDGRRKVNAEWPLSQQGRIVLMMSCVLSAVYGIVFIPAEFRIARQALQASRVGEIIEMLDSGLGGEGSTKSQERVVVLVDGEDFGCPMCVEDLHATCDSLNAISARYPKMKIAALFRGSRTASPDRIRLVAEAWAQSNHIQFPVVGDTERVSGAVGTAGSSIILLDRENKVILLEAFPLGAEKRSRILQMLLRMQ